MLHMCFAILIMIGEKGKNPIYRTWDDDMKNVKLIVKEKKIKRNL